MAPGSGSGRAEPYLITRKLINILRCEAEFAVRNSHSHSLPYVAVIDPLNICNLRCPFCPTGRR
ncbi:hypothetical protein DFAR_2230009 [Desulfarculales bacterium]